MTATESGARSLLVALLREAAQLEHSLLDAYLYTASSLKTTPQEFATIAGEPNRRRAVQFERVRSWKQNMLAVAHEEMLHLHYVECMLRALGEAPSFALPPRNDAGNWIVRNWQQHVAPVAGPADKGVEIPVAPLADATIRHFVLYEASDSLQDADPFGDTVMALFERLSAFELDLRLESMLLSIDDDAARELVKAKLKVLYTELTPLEVQEKRDARALFAAPGRALPPIDTVRFQSIADLYKLGILPLYEEAFRAGSVTYSNLNLSNEIVDPRSDDANLIAIGPVNRDKDFDRQRKVNYADPLRNYRSVQAIVEEIVEEGEGMGDFLELATTVLDAIDQRQAASPSGVRAYAQSLAQGKGPPDWAPNGERLRQSHLYRFATIMSELSQERKLAEACGAAFEPSRAACSVATDSGLAALTRQLPEQLNACFLVLLTWLSRMYEVKTWLIDTPRRLAIETLATWPLMSLAIRPMLELASFLPIDCRRLFRVELDALPILPIHMRELLDLFHSLDRSERINARQDYLAVRVLADVAQWAIDQQSAVQRTSAVDANSKRVMLDRLRMLSELSEFQKQFPFRVHGGYSGQLPDAGFQNSEPQASRFEEDPTMQLVNPTDPTVHIPIFRQTLALRLRFAGRALVQLATDPDPPTDEAGCSGTHMLHAADGDRRLDRSLVWQMTDPARTIRRDVAADLPEVGVNCVDVTLVVTNGGGVSAGYVPYQTANFGIQKDLAVRGFHDLCAVTPKQILGDGGRLRVDLLAKKGINPYLYGSNHLVWQDGEPIEPFVLAVLADVAGAHASATPTLVFQREVFSGGLTLPEMSPLERINTARAPCGFDYTQSIPLWARRFLPSIAQDLLATKADFSSQFLAKRADTLGDRLADELARPSGVTQDYVDAVVSLAERMKLVSVPRSTTVNWLQFLLHYGHSLSGSLTVSEGDNPILAALGGAVGLRLAVADPGDRGAPNGRWLVKYSMGTMDTDALSNFAFGELYIPLMASAANEPVHMTKTWTFPANMKLAVIEYSCRFSQPFWAPYTINPAGTQRVLTPSDLSVTDDLVSQDASSYTYDVTGLVGVSASRGAFRVQSGEDRTILDWQVSFTCTDQSSIVAALAFIAAAADQMTAALTSNFGPVPFVSE